MDMYILSRVFDSTFDAVVPLGVHKMELSKFLLPGFKMTATLASGVFCGTAISFLFTDLPIYLTIEPSVAIESFRIKLERSSNYQGPLGILIILSTSSVYLLDRKNGFPWLLGGLLFASSGILSGSFIKKPIARLLQETKSREVVQENFLELGKLHLVRTVIGFAGFGIFVYQLAFT